MVLSLGNTGVIVIAVQRDILPIELTDEELAEKGVDMLLLDQERKLAEQIKEFNQNGEFGEANRCMRELLKIQKLQPDYIGVKLRK